MKIRELFPITKKWLYFDAASISPYSLPVIKALKKFEKERLEYGSIYYDRWCSGIEECRTLAAKLLGAKKSEIALIKNTSEGINLVALILDWKKGDNVIVAEQDFPANIYPFLNLRKRGVEPRYVKGYPSPEGVEEKMDKRTKLISISSVIYSNGFRVDVEEIGKICEENEVYFHVDATQSLGALATNVKKMKADFLSAAGYKWLLSPLGTGIFFIKEELLNGTPVLGWRSVKQPLAFDAYKYRVLNSAGRFELGNPDIGAFLGMRAALKLINSIRMKKIEKRILYLASLLLGELNRLNVEILSNGSSGIVSFKAKIKKGDLLKNRVAASVKDYVRLSPHIYNNESDVLRLAEIIKHLTASTP